MKTLFSHSQQLSLSKVRKTRLHTDYITNNQILVVKKDIIAPIRSYESLKTKYMKVQSDIKLINSCKKESLIPTFAKFNLSIKNASRKLKSRIGRTVMESEIESKLHKKKKLKKDILLISNQLKIIITKFSQKVHCYENHIRHVYILYIKLY